MPSRNVTDVDGRTWACRQDDADAAALKMGQDVSILCTTASVSVPLRLTVGWKWMTMNEKGLARLISEASPLSRASEQGAAGGGTGGGARN